MMHTGEHMFLAAYGLSIVLVFRHIAESKRFYRQLGLGSK